MIMRLIKSPRKNAVAAGALWAVALAAAWLCAGGALYSEEGEDSRRQRRYEEAAMALSKAQQANNAERTVTIRVLDYQGLPVANVPLILIGNRYRAVVLPLLTKFHDVVKVRAVTGSDGKATFGPVVVGDFSIGIEVEGLPNGLDVEGGEEYYVPGPNVPVRDRGPRTAPGVDFQLYVHRFVGPRELCLMPMKSLICPPSDGTSVEWPYVSTDIMDRDAREILDPGLSSDFVVRFWRDPAVPFLVPSDSQGQVGMDEGSRIAFNAPYWFEIEAKNGGLQEVVPATADPQMAWMAPEDGYRQRVSWVHDPLAERIEGDGGSLRRASDRKRWFWWVRRGDKGLVFALISFRCSSGVDYRTKLPRILLQAQGIFNPRPGDRLIERPIGRHATWIKGFSGEEAEEWLKQMEPWQPYPAIPVPPLQVGWPPRVQNPAP